MKKFFALLLALAILICCFACGDDKSPDETGTGGTQNTGGTDTGSDTVGETEEDLDPKLEEQDFGGGKMIFLDRDRGTNYKEIGIFEDSANNVDSAVYWRNFKLNEKYNIEIDVLYKEFNQIHTFAAEMMEANDLCFDVIMAGPMYQINLATTEMLYEKSDIPVIDFNKAYWSQTVMKDTSIADKNYFFVSDANMWAMNAAGVVFFNTELVKELNFEKTPYDLVNEDNWTYDVMHSMSRQAYSDLDADGVVSLGDRFGSVSTPAATDTMFAGFDGLILTKNAQDIPELSVTTDSNIEKIQKIIEFWAEDSSLYITRFPSYASPRPGGNLLADTLLDGRALFSQEQLYQLSSFADSKYVIGMVPCPKYDENQENYKTYIHIAHSSSFSIPRLMGSERLTQVATVLEDMAYLSHTDVKSAYYDVNLKLRRAQDDESSAMLDIIFSNLTIDLGVVLQISGCDANTVIRQLVFDKNNAVSSALNGKVETYNSLINNLVESFTK